MKVMRRSRTKRVVKIVGGKRIEREVAATHSSSEESSDEADSEPDDHFTGLTPSAESPFAAISSLPS